MQINISSFAFHNDYPADVVIDGETVRVEPVDGCYLNGYVIVRSASTLA